MEPIFEQSQLLPVLEEALRRRICNVYVDRNLQGRSDLDEEHEATLFNNLPRIVQSISRVHSDKMEDYTAAIREDICAECVHQRLDGSCKLREEVRCVLDRYLLLIVETIEEAQGVQGKILHPH